MILIIDNYDSFTYNLVQYVRETGKEVAVYKNDLLEIRDIESLSPEGIIISPGPGTPEEAGICIEVIEKLGDRIPILGVCLGHQAIACAYGGKVERNWRLMHGKVSPIYHDGKGVYEGLKNPFYATRYHSLVVKEEALPAELLITSRTREGEIMGIRHRIFPVEGVQFHPESIMTEEGRKIIGNFIKLTRCKLVKR
ncbi:anthranilate synthase, component II [Thermosyntropha lipolytica DSM 11003]|uniref:Anthranilate synthase, component II n=1 Tax=Thermosyntropha lipolytica DSM 11003 TaxID=1123382 RepID=A0A1M5M4U0_9FIRM|nr:aminodeoxychorismate/anthranilate synthase component II [Thermosyntropha lipolytica]SHG72295.1 anthranilate synthase, component II [Thermosyntropha lipolytica DSM 11003]